jgi:hypothetical protein
MTLRTALILAALLFLLTLLARLPARTLVALLPPEVACEAPEGTVWHGSCAQLRGAGIAIGDISWTLHPWSLVTLALRVDLSSADPNAPGSGSVTARRQGNMSIQHLNATVPLPTGNTLLPPGTSAIVTLALSEVEIRDSHLALADGTVEVHQLHILNPPSDLGSYQLRLAPDAARTGVAGELHDLDGPLAVSGKLRLQSGGAYEINGSVAARATANGELSGALDTFLGPADAQGQHAFSITGTL